MCVHGGEVVAKAEEESLQRLAHLGIDQGRPARTPCVEQRSDAGAFGQAPHLAAPCAATFRRLQRLPYESSGVTELMVIRYDHRPMTFEKLERHNNVTQCFVPLDTMSWVMVVAPPSDTDDAPAPDSVRAFLVDGEQGVLMWKDTWHAFNRFPAAGPGVSFALLTGADTQEELERQKAGGPSPTLTHVVDYADRFGLSFRIADPHGLLAPAG